MPDYGKKEYWDDRYASETEPFDWLFSYADVKGVIEQIFARKQEILLVGCGNAPLSPVCTIFSTLKVFIL